MNPRSSLRPRDALSRVLWTHIAEATSLFPHQGRLLVIGAHETLPPPDMSVFPSSCLLETLTFGAPMGRSATYAGIVLIGTAHPDYHPPTLLTQLFHHLDAGAPLIILRPRSGLLGFPDTSWSACSGRQWRRWLHAAGWHCHHSIYLGFSNDICGYWGRRFAPWATAALVGMTCYAHPPGIQSLPLPRRPSQPPTLAPSPARFTRADL